MRIAVIGGGIAGLTAAYALSVERPESHIEVFEASPRVGGKLALGSVAGTTVDLGAESILARRPEGVSLASAVGLTDLLVHPEPVGAAIWTRGALRPLPPTVMGVPADRTALEKSGIIDWPARAEPALIEAVATEPDGRDVSVADFVRSRMGAGAGQQVIDRLIEPLLGGVYAGHASRLSLHSAAPQIAALGADGADLLAAAQKHVAKAGLLPPEPVFVGLTGGVGQLPAAVAAASKASIHTGSTVRVLERVDAGWRLTVGPTTSVTYVDVDAIVVATPAAASARLLSDIAPRAATALQSIDYASMAIVTMALPTGGFAAAPAGSGFLVPPVDGKTIKAATFSTNKWSWLAQRTGPELSLIRCSIGRAGETQMLQRDDADIVAAALADLREAIGPTAAPVDAHVQRWGGALPQYDVGHGDRIDRIATAVAEIKGLEVCGAAYEGIGIPAVIASARRAAARLVESLGTMEP